MFPPLTSSAAERAGGKSFHGGCPRLYTRAHWHRAARAVYDGREKATAGEVRRLRKRGRCQLRPRASLPLLRRHRASYRAHHLQRLELIYLTPYVCPGFGRSPIPCSIVWRESNYRWDAYNPSGACGPFQIMPVHGRPCPIVTAADRAEHIRIAAHLWAGGAGASHWAATYP